MECSKNFKKITPEEFRHARDNIRIVHPKIHLKALMYRGNFEYNSNKINRFSARLEEEREKSKT